MASPSPLSLSTIRQSRELPAATASFQFLSLKWKALLLSSLVLIAIVCAFCAISYFSLINQFGVQRDREHGRHAKIMTGLIEQSSQRLQQIGSVIPYLEGMGDGLGSGKGANIHAAFDEHWPLLQLQTGIDEVRFYSIASILLARAGNADMEPLPSMELVKVKESIAHEYPLSYFDCRQTCMQYAVLPVLVDGRNAGAVVVGSSLVDAVLAFKLATGQDIGLLVADDSPFKDSDQPGKLFPGWKMREIALTDSERNLAILHDIAHDYPQLQQLSHGVQRYLNNSYYEVSLLPVNGFSLSDKPHLLVLTDITSAIKGIHTLIKQSLVIGLVGLLISEFILFSILSGPLSRLRHTAQTLPLLAKSAFEDVRRHLRHGTHRQWLHDETDVLDETATALSYQLEALEGQVRERSVVLARRMEELAQERDFVSNLLNTAQVIVLTQNQDGAILSLNSYGELLIRYEPQELTGQPFSKLVPESDGVAELHRDLEQLRLGQREQLRHEAVTKCKDDSTCHIVWLHSRLKGRGANDPVVLSVGLDITERKQAESRLSWLANHDPLTGLLNRRGFQEELEQTMAIAQRYKRSGALLFFDLDQFKYVNDTSGHHAGDVLLKSVSEIMLSIVRGTDVVGRLGGDEFGIVLREISGEEAVNVARKIVDRFRETEIPLQGRVHKVSASIGIALFPQHAANVNELLAVADLAMYQAKEAGRGGWHLFSSEDRSRERMHALVYWKEKIERAIVEDCFVLYYQPILHLPSGTISHYEVLLRMLDDDGSIIGPTSFIPAAERTGLIHEIDHLVLRKAIAQAAILQRQGQDIFFSINLSAHSFDDHALLTVLKAELERHAADPATLIFEITETAALADSVAARKLMESIKALGCKFALDDFGVGFSSFYYLKQLPIDYVKIDGSFITQLAHNPDDRILVKALSEVARGFGKKTVAECVENAVTLTLLREFQVEFAQGYHIGKPAPAEVFFDTIPVSVKAEARG